MKDREKKCDFTWSLLRERVVVEFLKNYTYRP